MQNDLSLLLTNINIEKDFEYDAGVLSIYFLHSGFFFFLSICNDVVWETNLELVQIYHKWNCLIFKG